MNPPDLLIRILFGYGYVALWLPPILLSIPPAAQRRSAGSFFRALLWNVVGIMVPASWFFASVALLPEWKGGCRYGAFSCFVLGKLWLSPLVLWALAAFYVRVVLKTRDPLQPWIVLGYWTGAGVSGACLIHGVIALWDWSWGGVYFTVPILTALYYTVVARRLSAASKLKAVHYWSTFLAGSPFWGLSIWQSMRTFDSLPDQAPECFVVTAAMKGHPGLVGPFVTVYRGGRERQVNQQLQTFWLLETVWASRFPGMHRAFRRVYSVLGPAIARRLSNPWLADAAYLFLKPLECLAGSVVGRGNRHRCPST